MKKQWFAFVAEGLVAAACIGSAQAAVTGNVGAVVPDTSFKIAHTGATDPSIEGFGLWPWNFGNSTAGPVHNDLGLDAWSITGLTKNQYGYFAGPLTLAQQQGIANGGFVLNLVERVSLGTAQPYASSAPFPVSAVAVYTGAKRFDIELGVDGSGDTVVILPDYVSYQGGALVTPGASLTLTGLGNGYHTFGLAYHPTTQLADLFVDGTMRIGDYSGLTYNTAEGNSRGLYSLLWASVNGGQANFNSVQFMSPTPEPDTYALMLAGLALIGAVARRRKA